MNFRSALALTVVVAEPVVGVEIRIAVELIGRAVEVIATALGIDQNHDARTAAILGVEVSGEGLEFADCVETQRGIFTIVRAYVGVDDAVEEEVVRGAAHSVDIEIIGLVEDQAELRIVVGDNAGQGGQQRFKIAAIQRLLGDLTLVNHGCVAGSRSVNQRGLGGDGHGLRSLPQRQGNLPETQALVLIENDSVPVQFLHTRSSHFDLVGGGGHVQCAKVAAGVGSGLARQIAGRLVDDLDLGSGNGGARRDRPPCP